MRRSIGVVTLEHMPYTALSEIAGLNLVGRIVMLRTQSATRRTGLTRRLMSTYARASSSGELSHVSDMESKSTPESRVFDSGHIGTGPVGGSVLLTISELGKFPIQGASS